MYIVLFLFKAAMKYICEVYALYSKYIINMQHHPEVCNVNVCDTTIL